VLSYKPKGGDDVLYTRPDAVFDKSKPISGGLPHCWPQFGPGAIQTHGFARNVDWELVSTNDGDEPSMTMALKPSAYSKKMWDKEFVVTETVKLTKTGALEATLVVENKGKESFDFTGSFHTYLSADISKVAVGGLNGCTVFDRLASKESKVSGDVTIAGPVDSVYSGRPETLTLNTGKRTVTIKGSKTWTEAVVWSPWTSMEACYKEFVCVEDAAVTPVVVPAGGKWTATTVLSA
jgi:glucose-6-phosphate 1-epimerase